MRAFMTMCVASLVGILALSAVVQAAPISVVNPGFDYVVGKATDTPPFTVQNWYGDGAGAAWSDASSTPTKFTDYGGGGYTQMMFDGWKSTSTTAGTSFLQMLTPTSYFLYGIKPEGGSGDVRRIGTALGNLYQDIPGALMANTTYTLTMDLYARSQGWIGDSNVSIYLADATGTPLDGGVLTVTAPVETPATAGYATYTVETGDNVTSGALKIWISVKSSATDYRQMIVDNVSLDAVTIPEPSTFTILIVGLVGLLCYAWKKRR